MGAADVGKLVAGPRVYICDRCAAEVVRIMNESHPSERSSETRRGVFAVLVRRVRALVGGVWPSTRHRSMMV
jgi:ATP-dependent protease Clp ATPase subunit